MIVVCEPQSKGISHEKVNSGYIYGLSLAYPKEKIIFFADRSHYKELKDMFKSNRTPVQNLKHLPINFNAGKSFSILGIVRYYLLLKKIFDKLLTLEANRIFFLSTNPIILYVIKKLKQQSKYKNICCTFVLHGELEDIANINYKEPYIPVFKNRSKFNLLRPGVILLLVRQRLAQPFIWLNSNYSLIFKKMLRVKKILMWQHSNQYKYIVMSPHILANAKEYLDTDYLNFHTIILPIIFAKPTRPPNNEFIKFAVFGYGDSAQMFEMLTILSRKKAAKPYEIRIISMDSRGTEGFPNITRLSQGRVLTRKEMEDATGDIDIFINLYDKTRHRFGCSLSIFEAFSYLKPVLHLSNPGYNYFNKPAKPIGFRTENLNDFVRKMRDMIENCHLYKKELMMFRENMMEYRKEYAIENNLDNLRKSFTFN